MRSPGAHPAAVLVHAWLLPKRGQQTELSHRAIAKDAKPAPIDRIKYIGFHRDGIWFLSSLPCLEHRQRLWCNSIWIMFPIFFPLYLKCMPGFLFNMLSANLPVWICQVGQTWYSIRLDMGLPAEADWIGHSCFHGYIVSFAGTVHGSRDLSPDGGRQSSSLRAARKKFGRPARQLDVSGLNLKQLSRFFLVAIIFEE